MSPSLTNLLQVCLSHLASDQVMLESLAVSLLGNISGLASTQPGSYFLQKLVNILGTRHSASEALHILTDEMIRDLVQVKPLYSSLYSEVCVQLATTEPASRLVQEVVRNSQDAHLLLSIIRWIEENLKYVIVNSSAVFLAMTVLEKLLKRSSKDKVWAKRLETFASQFTDSEENLLMVAALNPTGHLLVKMILSNLKLLSEVKQSEVISCLAKDVDTLVSTKTGAVLLKEIDNIM